MRKSSVLAGLALSAALAFCGTMVTTGQQKSMSDEGGRVLALETAWNHALETKEVKALNMVLDEHVRVGGCGRKRGVEG